jgi:hypothetical protein
MVSLFQAEIINFEDFSSVSHVVFSNVIKWSAANNLVLHGVSKKFSEWYQKTNETEDTNKLTLLAFKIIAIQHNSVLWRIAIILKANKDNLFVSSVLFVFCYHSPNFLDTPHISR